MDIIVRLVENADNRAYIVLSKDALKALQQNLNFIGNTYLKLSANVDGGGFTIKNV